jgi:catechol 2,3-dioxygenase-like lactoylglutathione lyase family enzyme
MGRRRITGIGFVGWRVADAAAYDATVALYRDVLGAEVTRVDGRRSVRFRLPDGTGLHVYGPDDVDHVSFGDRACVGTAVDDVVAVWDALTSAGIEILDAELERDGTDAWFHYRAPDGSVGEIIGPDRTGRASARQVRFGHVNLIGRDWRRLAAFYTEVFGCRLVPPERDIRGAALDAATGLHDAHLTGAHLRLPGHGEDGPTLEIYAYDALEPELDARANRPGWGHVAFAVPDVGAALAVVVAAGCGRLGEIVTTATSDGRQVTWCYATDPEGNIVELQAWSGG